MEPLSDPAPTQSGTEPDAEPPSEPTSEPSGVAPQPQLEAREPPLSWQRWEIGPGLSEREKRKLRAFFDRQMRNWAPLTSEGRTDLESFARRIGYHLIEIEGKKLANGDTSAVLHLEPVTLVRRVNVTIDNNVLELFDAVFSDEITRRMRLRAGAALERDPERRAQQYKREAERIATYLRGEGYFEAKVAIVGNPDGDNAVRLEVDVDKKTRYQIGRVQVEGNRAVPTAEIVEKFRGGQLCLFGVCLLKRFSQQSLNRYIQEVIELYQKRGFPAVRVRTDYNPKSSFDRRSKTVSFKVFISERRQIDVVFEGNDPRRFPPDDLEKRLTFDQEGSYDDVEVSDSAEAIRLYYQSRGYFEANVTFERTRFRFLERIVFTIDPGARLQVQSILFEGNQAIETRDLSRSILTQVRSTSTFFNTSRYTTSRRLEQDAQRIAREYQKIGFANAEVTVHVSRSAEVKDSAPALAAMVASEAPTRGLFVRFFIDEGPRIRVERIELMGNTLATESLESQLGFAAGQPYDREKIARGRQELKRYYFGKAYPRAEIRVEEAPGAAPDSMVIRYIITENAQARFGEVLVQGNFKTDEWIIRDELGFDADKPLSLVQAERGQQNLRSTGLFNAVQVTFIDLEDGDDENVNVLVQVEERHDYRLGGELAFGLSTDRGLFGEVGLLNANLLGKGLRVDVRGQYATEFDSVTDFLDPESDFLSIEGKVTAPRWITRRLTGGLFSPRLETAAFWRQEPTERFGALTSYGISVGLSRAGRSGFFKDWLLSVRYDLRQRNRDEDLVRSAGPSEDIEQAKVKTRTGAFGPQILIDKRRDVDGRLNPLAPTSGFKIELRALLAHEYLFGDDNFIKLGIGGQHFWQPFKRVLVSNGLRYDHGIPLGAVLLPEVERFFAGGDTTVRGFEEDRLATEIIESQVPPYNDVTRIQVLPAGGNIRLIHNFDVQVEVGELGGFPVASAVFIDTGLVTNSLEDFAFTDLRHALGVALLRWVTPLSSLSLEWAIPLDPKPGDNPRGRFHLNLGLLF